MSIYDEIENALRDAGQSDQIPGLQRFFKTGPGDYAEGDLFWGLKVPQTRTIAKHFQEKADFSDIKKLLLSPVHECRLAGIFLLVYKFTKSKSDLEKAEGISLYESHFSQINNWDLVDSSAPYLTGPWYFSKDRSILDIWAASSHLWTQRIAVMTTFYFIRQRDFTTTLTLADTLLNHPHDLIHKAVGWMIREVGNRDMTEEENFLTSVPKAQKGMVLDKPRYLIMPRTMLRYATEKFPEEKRQRYLKGLV